ncbi:D-alanyl-D-alanine carboxypeptidase family protein [Desmospora activa]|uniref:serine-type D-Ala-D-Ala carboxypeptidase n=1 Tax=Desmospora activa DSM 45169 TaxID=1121389 RepID=A0A2T4Z4V5_9BACL|nr:D-alanyl-D-alanine carboxypeptidase family protein [Desmospora activa]PTM56923.1 D-alanyl-D-alanine carboxypeptidase (penicillin-binding protein 5/6) [Desmospora activa DSM 45169]
MHWGQSKRQGEKALLLCLIISMFLGLWMPTTVVAEQDESLDSLQIQSRSYVLLEMESGRIIAGENEQKAYAPASLTKMMTEYVILQEIKESRLDWDETVTVSKNAASIGEAQVFLRKGEKRTVEELFYALSIQSANDAAVALAEHVAGSETAFVGMMNETAKEMGLEKTHFRNSTGLPMWLYVNPPKVGGDHVMSATDVAVLTRRLLHDYPEVQEIISQPRYFFRKGEAREMKLINTNRMLPGLSHYYEGVDGVKTGFTSRAGYCFAGSAQQDGVRLITVVMGSSSKSQRFKETAKLLDYGFEQIQLRNWIKEGDSIPGMNKVQVEDGVETEVALQAEVTLRYPVRKGEEDRYSWAVDLDDELTAPLKTGDVVGKATFLYDGKEVEGVKPISIVVAQDVEAAGWLRLFCRRMIGYFSVG